MRTTLLATFVGGLLLNIIGPARADDAAVRPIIAKAIKALGDEATLAKWKGATWRSKGTLHAMGAELPFTGEWAMLYPDKARMVFEVDAGQKINVTLIYAGAKGWMRINDAQPTEMDKERLTEQKESMHHGMVARLLVLKEKAYTLSPLGEVMVDNKPAVGVKVAHKDHRDINLFFDKNTGLLAKSAMRVKTDQGEEVNQEMFYSDYKVIEGAKVPMKLVIKRDGQTYLESETTEWKPAEKLDDKLFEKP